VWCGFGLLGARDRLGAVQNDGHYLHGEAREDKGLRMYEDRGLGFQGLGGLGLGQRKGWELLCRIKGTTCPGQPGHNKGCEFMRIKILGFGVLDGGLAGRECTRNQGLPLYEDRDLSRRGVWRCGFGLLGSCLEFWAFG
jgi:hypothetical protein